MKKIRVLVVDDSALVRTILCEGLNRYPNIDVVGSAQDPYAARDKIVLLKPDVLTLDVEMPRMNGVEFLRKLMPQYPLPVVMVSSLTQDGKQTTLDALAAGAVDFIAKPTSDMLGGLQSMLAELAGKIDVASKAKVTHWRGKNILHGRHQAESNAVPLTESTNKVLAIGASTGGVEALHRVVQGFPASMPGVLIVQHMPPGFTTMFSERLNQFSAMEVKEAESGDKVLRGRVLVAPGDRHLRIRRTGVGYCVELGAEEKVCGHRPSVDVLMLSMAAHVGGDGVGAILPGMGGDGANGLYAMRQAGARTVAQDERTSVVFGMPKVAYELGATGKLVPLDEMAATLVSYMAGRSDG